MKKNTNKNVFKSHRKSGLDFNRNRERHFFVSAKPWIALVSQILIVIALAFVISYTFFCGVSVSGISMEPTLYSRDRVLINRASSFMNYKRGDVVAFSTIVGGAKSTNVKRIVGVPGDDIVIMDGILYVNGIKEESSGNTETISEAGTAKNHILLDKGQYFMLGDNRNNSEDSRYETIGLVRNENIYGKIWICVSFPNFGRIRKL